MGKKIVDLNVAFGYAWIGTGQVDFGAKKFPGGNTFLELRFAPVGIRKYQSRDAVLVRTLSNILVASVDIVPLRQRTAKNERDNLLVWKHEAIGFHQVFN